MAHRAMCLSRERAVAFQTFRINFGLFFFFFNLKISFAIPHSWHYRISYLSTRKVVSVENLTGLFPSTCVTLVTCRDKTYSEVSISHHFPTQEAQVSHSDTVKEDRTNPELVNRKSVFTKGFGQRMLR